MVNSLLICPEYFDGRLNGIGHGSEAICGVLSLAAFSTEGWSANEAKWADFLPPNYDLYEFSENKPFMTFFSNRGYRLKLYGDE
jgi:hypothetical protein